MLGQANNQIHIADRVGLSAWIVWLVVKHLRSALKFRHCDSIATEILLDGNTAIAAEQISSITEAENLYSSLNDSFQKLVTLPYVQLNEAVKHSACFYVHYPILL